MLDQTKPDRSPQGSAAGAETALREALRRARLEAVEQIDVVIDLREAEMTRLEILRDALEPIFAQVPKEVDLFDVGLAQGERPRLFIDMVSFVEMGRDRRLYRFMRDGRNGRSCAAESESLEPIVEAVTAYVARRLVERERLLADDHRLSSTEVGGRPLQEAAKAAGLADQGDASPGGRSKSQTATGIAAASAPPSAVRSLAPTATAATKKRGSWIGALLKLSLSFGLGIALGGVVTAAFVYAVAKGLLPF